MRKNNCIIKIYKWIKTRIKETNVCAYLALLIFFTGLFFCSLIFDTTEKPFTIFSSIGCGGIASVVVAWLVEKSTNRINRNRTKTVINQLLYGFDTYVTVECQRAIRHCSKKQDIDIDKSYSMPEIISMIEKVDNKDVYFRGFPDMIEKGLNGITEVTLLSFDQSKLGSTLYDLFLALRSTIHTMSHISEIDNLDEMMKIMVIDCFDFINQINITRGKNCTYQIPEDSKKYIKSFRKTMKNQEEND